MAIRTDLEVASVPRATDRPAPDAPAPGGGRARPRGPRWTSPRGAVAAVLAALLLGALMNGPGLRSAATGLPVGTTRDVAMAVAGGVARTGAALGLDRPHRWLTTARDASVGTALGNAAGSEEVAGAGAAGAPRLDGGTPPARGPDPAATDGDRSDGNAAAPPSSGTGADVTARSDQRRNRSITADAPLEVLLAGDSLMGAIADGFARRTVEDELITTDKDVRISTGLARPDVLNWPLHLQQLLDARDPDVVMLLLGGNDDQSLVGGPDGVVHYGQPGWEQEYRARVARLQTIASEAGRTVVWLELPAVRRTDLEQARQRMNAAARQAAQDTGALVLDTDAILAPEGYTPRLDGIPVRAEDGVHLTHPGGDLVAAELDRLLADRFGLPSG